MPRLRISTELLPATPAASSQPAALVLRARAISGTPDAEVRAEGDVELRRAGLLLRADSLVYDSARDLVTAQGQVRVRRPGLQFSMPQAQLQVQGFQGVLTRPEFRFDSLGTQGRAERMELLSSRKVLAEKVQYTSCQRDGTGMPDWLLSANSLSVDIDANEGIAKGAVLRFLGVPLMALPTISFPVTSARKSGWLPPSVYFDTRSGAELAVPYYWNIAPNLDATLTPRVITRRGIALDTELRYLRPQVEGEFNISNLPNDQVAGRSRYSVYSRHEANPLPGLRITAAAERVSDDEWWKDFPRSHKSFTARLLPASVMAEQNLQWGGFQGTAYAGAQWWQTLQASDSTLVSPYQRSPQVGLRSQGDAPAGLKWTMETELNRFTLGPGSVDDGRVEGWRWHGIGTLSAPQQGAGWFVNPRVQLNTARYRTDTAMVDGRVAAVRTIPSFNLDAGLEFERDTQWLGRSLRQTLEPRLLYVNTPYRAQDSLPNFDASGKDFNLSSLYSDNPFSGVDRVADAHQVTAGLTSRWLDAETGGEALRFTVMQRYLLRQQRITPEGEPFTRSLSDLLLLASTNLLPSLSLDARVQYSPDISRPVRSILSARYSPGPYRTVAASYRYARGLSELIDLGWQWPVYRGDPQSTTGCHGTLYSVGRVNYSMRDSRVTDSLLGLEYDSGCWITRLVAERLSTGLSTATTRYHVQLELVGLSRLGSNPLRVLKDNISGYRLLRDDERGASSTPPPYE
jgi:LPS-assembly protein